MKKGIFFLSIWCIAATCYCQPQTSQLKILGLGAFTSSQFGLSGPVKTLEEEYTKTFSDGSKLPGNKYTYRFDSLGLLIESTRKINFNGLDLGTEMYKFFYDKNGMLLTEERTTLENPNKKEVSTYHYGATGSLQSMEKKEGDKVLERTTYEPTANHLLAVKKMFRRAETAAYLIQRFAYDAKGRVIAREDEDIYKKPNQKHLFSYVGDNVFYTTESLDGGALLYPATDGVSEAFVYNERGDITQRNTIGKDGKPDKYSNSFTYDYDAMGNWTSQSQSGSFSGFALRTIQYYGEPDPKSPSGIYKKAIQEGIDPTLKTLQFILEMATSKKQPQEQILKNIATLATTVDADLKYVQTIKVMPGNNAKQLSLELLNFIAAPQMQTDLKLITADPAKNNALVTSNMQFLTTKLAAIGTELQKLK